MRAAGLAAALALLAAAPAPAAPFGELPFLATFGTATCLRATGEPGELVRSSPSGARFMTVTPSGVADGPTVITGVARGDCPQVAARPGGAGVIAQAGSGLWVATREPGGVWSTPFRLDPEASQAAVDVAASGAAVVAWAYVDSDRHFVVKAAVRAAGAAFGPAATLADVRTAAPFASTTVGAAMAADGEAIVEWTQPLGNGVAEVDAAIAPPAGAFGARQRIGSGAATAAPALAAAPDGSALLATWSGKAVEVAERAPGQAFGPLRPLAPATDPAAVVPGVAIAPGGAAAVAWSAYLGGATQVAVRAAGGAFGAPVTLARGSLPPGVDALAAVGPVFDDGSQALGIDGASPDGDGGNPRVQLGADGRALITWKNLVEGSVPHAASLPLAGDHLDRQDAGPAIRPASSIAPLTLADGRAAVAWSDNSYEEIGRAHV